MKSKTLPYVHVLTVISTLFVIHQWKIYFSVLDTSIRRKSQTQIKETAFNRLTSITDNRDGILYGITTWVPAVKGRTMQRQFGVCSPRSSWICPHVYWRVQSPISSSTVPVSLYQTLHRPCPVISNENKIYWEKKLTDERSPDGRHLLV